MTEKNHNDHKNIALSLAVITYNRSDGLFDKFLEALYTVVTATLSPDEIIVINNDDVSFEATLSSKINLARDAWLSRAQIESLSNINWPDVVVETSPEKNLSVARNLAIETARAPMLVFIDDDQYVQPTWLQELVSCMEHYKADVVAGPVYCQYPSSAPLWLQYTDIHNTRGHATGDKLFGITAGNALIRLSSIEGHRFDSRFGRTGGEDTDLFKRLYALGRDIRWCNEAASSEWITADRAKAGYAIRRFIDQGQTYRRMFLAEATFSGVLLFYARALVQTVVAGLIAIVFVALKKPAAGDWVKRCFNNVGKLVKRKSSDYS